MPMRRKKEREKNKERRERKQKTKKTKKTVVNIPDIIMKGIEDWRSYVIMCGACRIWLLETKLNLFHPHMLASSFPV